VCIFLFKESVFDRLSSTGFRVRKKYKTRNGLSQETLFGSSPIIDADFIEVDAEVDEDFFHPLIPLLNLIQDQLARNFWKISENTLEQGPKRKFLRSLKRFAKFLRAEVLKVISGKRRERRSLLIKWRE
jgi:hypothetical protein